MAEQMKETYIVVSMNITKVGYYVFTKFENGSPKFESNMSLSNYKVYKSKSAAEHTANKIQSYYKDKFEIITKVVSSTDMEEVHCTWDMEKFLRKSA